MKNEIQRNTTNNTERASKRKGTYEVLNREVIESAMHKSPVFGFAQNFAWYWKKDSLHIMHEENGNYRAI